jgi:hypothetical protein
MAAPKTFQVVAWVGAALLCSTASAADPPPNPNADAIAAAQQLKDLVNAQKDLLNAQKELIDAKFPRIQGGLPGEIKQGTGSLYNLGAVAEATQRLVSAAEGICAKVKSKEKPTKVVVAGIEESHALLQYSLAAIELGTLDDDTKALVGDVPTLRSTLPVYAAGAAITMLTDFAKLFRTDRTIYNETVVLNKEILVDKVSLCMGIDPTPWTVEYPRSKLDATVRQLDQDPFWKRVSEVQHRRGDLARLIAQGAEANATREAKDKAAKAQELTDRLAAFMKAVLGVDTVTSQSALGIILLGELVRSALVKPARLLVVHLPHQGGFSMVTKSIWREDRLYVSGGVIATYRVTDSAGNLIASDYVREVDPKLHRVKLSD